MVIIPLNENNQAIRLEAFLLTRSSEFQSDKKRPTIIICPGGAYMGTSDREAEPVALRFLAQGYHAFVLRYSTRTRFLPPMLDLTPERVKANALLLGYPVIDLDMVADHLTADAEGRLVPLNELVNAQVSGAVQPDKESKDQYHSDLHLSSTTPPTFIWHTTDDQLVFASNSLRFAATLAGLS